MSNALTGLLTGISMAANGSSASGEKSVDTDAFMGFMKTFMEAASGGGTGSSGKSVQTTRSARSYAQSNNSSGSSQYGVSAASVSDYSGVTSFAKKYSQSAAAADNGGRAEAQRWAEPNESGAAEELSDEEKCAVERIAVLVADGGLDRDKLADLSEEDWAELEEWALAGAGGLFASIETTATLPELGFDVSAALTGGEGTEATEGAGGAAAGNVLEIMKTLLASGSAIQEADTSLLGQTLSLGSLDAEQLTALSEALAEALSQISAQGDAGAAAQTAGLDKATLAQTLEQSFAAAGLESPLAAEEMAQLPQPVLESLAAEIVAYSSDESASGQSRDALLGELARTSQLRDELNGASAQATEAAPADAKTALAPSAVAETVEVAEETIEAKTHKGKGAETAEVEDIATTGADGAADAETADAVRAPETDSQAGNGEKDREGEKKQENSAISGNKDDAVETFEPFETSSAETFDSSLATVATAEGDETTAVSTVQNAAQDVSARNANSSSSASQSQTARAAYLAENIEKIESVMRMSTRQGTHNIELELSPAELGKISMRLEVRDGTVSAEIRTENSEARDLLNSGLAELKRNLEVHGIELDSFDVQLGGGGFEEGNSESWQSVQQQTFRGRATEQEAPTDTAVIVSGEPTGLYAADGSLNVVA